MSKHEIEKKYNFYINRIPLGYIGHPEDVADAVVFLASSLSRYITGSVIHVNGGMLML
jgi:3-oxoacyl-[acyl-carrier protein] reductase